MGLVNADDFVKAVGSITDAELNFIEKSVDKEDAAWSRKTKVTLKKKNKTIIIKRTGTRSFTIDGKSRTSRTARAASRKFGSAINDKLLSGWSWGKFKAPVKRKKKASKKAKKKASKKKASKKKTSRKKKTPAKKKICKKRGCKKPVPKQRGRGRPRKYCRGCGS